MTENQLRQKIVDTAVAWLGCKESDGSHKQIIDVYNAHKPLARGYKVKYTDAWCSTYASAVAIKAGLTDIIPTECGCEKHIELFKKLGAWKENDAYTPKMGDYIFYNWDDGGNYASTDLTASADHVGIVTKVSGNTFTVIEGNKSNAVGYRTMKVNGKYIRGFGTPDYASKATETGGGTSEAGGPTIYTVKAGDTLSKIANTYGTTVDALVEINAIINDYVEIEPQQPNAITAPPRFDISAIDFDLLRREFAKTRRKNLLMRDLDEAIRRQLDKMVFANPKRIDYYERYREIIQSYNGEQDRATIEKTFLDLMDLADRMSREEQRYAREGFASDEELSLYDMLFRDDLSKNDIKKLKTAASDLLRKIKTKISELDHWTDKQETRAVVDTLIRDVLWETLPECYNNDDITEYREKVYEYVFTRYKEIA